MISFAFLANLDFVLPYEGYIYLGSAVISFLLALVVFTLRRSVRLLKEKAWTRYFELTFFVLALMYSLRFVLWLTESEYPQEGITQPLALILKVLIDSCSGVTTFFFILAGFELADKVWLVKIKDSLIGSVPLRITLLVFLCVLALIPLYSPGPVAQVPDTMFSVLALILIGFGIYKNISYRHDRFMAFLALFSMGVYILLIVFYGLSDYFNILLQGRTGSEGKSLILLAFLLAVLTKVGLFFPGFSLMLSISEPVEGIERLLIGAIKRQQGVLDSGSIVTSIREALGVREVQLHVILPRVSKNQVALYADPLLGDGKGDKPRISDYEEKTDYDEVVKKRREIIDRHKNRWFWRRVSRMRVPVFFHDSVIAILKVEVGEKRFTKADQDKLLEIAWFISPVVQSDRQASDQAEIIKKLNEISPKLAQLQIDLKTYNIEKDVNDIAEIIHDVMSPFATGISIKAGFSEYYGIASLGPEGAKLMRDKLKAPHPQQGQAMEPKIDWKKKELKIAYSTEDGQNREQTLGGFILALDLEGEKKEHPTLAANLFDSNDISNLLSNALLNFMRGHLSQLTRILGTRLGGLEETNPEDWIRKVNTTAKAAGLLWAVAKYPDSEKILGEEKAIELVNRLGGSADWEPKYGCELCSVIPPRDGAYKVIKKNLERSEGTVWFGVARPEFDLEMDYVSPWAFFLDQFCKTADSALVRIRNKRKEEERKKEMAEFHGISMTAITTGTITHQLVNLVRSLTNPIMALEFAIKQQRLRGNEQHKVLILSMRQTSDKIDELIKVFSGVVKPDGRQPCSLREAVEQAQGLLEGSLKSHGIEFDYQQVPEGMTIDVPFHVAAAALANAVNNSRDAIRDARIKRGVIRISAEESDDRMFVCHVIDNGPGVPTSVQKTLFKEICKSQKQYSHGMGLYFSARSLRENGGDIRLTHPGPDPSTTFSIYFPRLRNTL